MTSFRIEPLHYLGIAHCTIKSSVIVIDTDNVLSAVIAHNCSSRVKAMLGITAQSNKIECTWSSSEKLFKSQFDQIISGSYEHYEGPFKLCVVFSADFTKFTDSSILSRFGSKKTADVAFEIIIDTLEKADLLLSSRKTLLLPIDKSKELREHVKNGHSEEVKAILDSTTSHIDARDENSETPLMLACRYNKKDTARLLLQRGADKEAKDKHGNTILMLACYDGKTDIAEILLDYGANIEAMNDFGSTSILLASKNDHRDTVAYLMDRGANKEIKNNDGWTALMLACDQNHINTVMLLLATGVDKEACNREGNTALTLACEKDHLDIVILLLESGANINNRNKIGNTALMVACSHGKTNAASLLLGRGAEIDATNKDGWTALILACNHGKIDTAALLIERGANMNAKNKHGDSALILASLNGKADIIALLLSKGADKELKNFYGKTARQCAEDKGHASVVALLKSNSATVDNYIALERRPSNAPKPSIATPHGSTDSLNRAMNAEVSTPRGFDNNSGSRKSSSEVDLLSPSTRNANDFITASRKTSDIDIPRTSSTPRVSAVDVSRVGSAVETRIEQLLTIQSMALSSSIALGVMRDIFEFVDALPVFGSMVRPLTLIFDKIWKACEKVVFFVDVFHSFANKLKQTAKLLYAKEDGLIVIASIKSAGPSLKEYIDSMLETLSSVSVYISPFTKASSFISCMMGSSKLCRIIQKADTELSESINALSLRLTLSTLYVATNTYNVVTDIHQRIEADYGGIRGIGSNPDVLQQLAKELNMNTDDLKSALDLQLRRDEDEANEAIRMCEKNEAIIPQISRELESLRMQDQPPTIADLHDTLKVDYNNLLGKGGSASVYAGRYLNQDVAVKVFASDNDVLKNMRSRDLLLREIAIQQKLSALPGVARMYGASVDSRMIVMERAQGNLSTTVHQGFDTFSVMTKLTIFHQIAQTLRAIHQLGVIHRDIKPLNILVFRSKDDIIKAKLADFGYAKELSMQTSGSKVKGTMAYMAPEVFRGVYSGASDIYALGITMGEVMSVSIPYNGVLVHNEFEFADQIRGGLRPTLNVEPKNAVSEKMVHLVKECWAGDATKRPSIDILCDRIYEIMVLQSSLNQFGSRAIEIYKDTNTIPLADLTMEQVCCMLSKLSLKKWVKVVQDDEITGAFLSNVEPKELQDFLKLDAVRARTLAGKLEVYKREGVPANLVE